jgi:hypothetical protein
MTIQGKWGDGDGAPAGVVTTPVGLRPPSVVTTPAAIGPFTLFLIQR